MSLNNIQPATKTQPSRILTMKKSWQDWLKRVRLRLADHFHGGYAVALPENAQLASLLDLPEDMLRHLQTLSLPPERPTCQPENIFRCQLELLGQCQLIEPNHQTQALVVGDTKQHEVLLVFRVTKQVAECSFAMPNVKFRGAARLYRAASPGT